MKTRRFTPWLVAALLTLTLVVAGVVYALSLGNVDGVWGNVDGVAGQGGATCLDYWSAAGVAGVFGAQSLQAASLVDENQVRYGVPQSYDSCPTAQTSQNARATAFALQSGFGFDGTNNVGVVSAGGTPTPFPLGQFTHYNKTIDAPADPFGYVVNDITVSGMRCLQNNSPTPAPTPIGGDTFTFQYRFNLNETVNTFSGGSCIPYTPVPGFLPCPDIVTVSGQVSNVKIACPEGNYTIQIAGFQPLVSGTCANQTYNPSLVKSEFVTNETLANSACLWAQVVDFVPTAIKLRSFTATGGKGLVQLNWTTVSEVDNAGFNLWRAEQVKGEKIKINADPISTNQPPGSPSGAAYAYKDTTAVKGKVYYYWLEDVDVRGGTGLHGPVRALAK